MNHLRVAIELGHNKEVLRELMVGADRDMYLWRPAEDKWSMLEVLCHLYDEECEDFRLRIQMTLETPELPWPPIDPPGWVIARGYQQRDFSEMLHSFMAERARSVTFLNNLSAPAWHNAYQHPRLGSISAQQLLVNWLAHDYHHIRQINALKYQYLAFSSGADLSYAGKW